MRWTDHKTVGLQYGLTALVFLLVGFLLMILMRWQLAWPGQPLPSWIAMWLGEGNAPGGIMLPEFYNQLVAMHGSVMVFLAIVPLAAGAFANYLVPDHIGAPEMAFPRLNAWSYWLYLVAGVIMVASFFVEGGAANSGWTSYAPLAVIATTGQNFWLAGIFLIGVSSALNAINMIVTIVQCRAAGLTLARLPFFVWSQLVTALLLLLAFPALQAAAVLQLMDRTVGTSFFLPSGLMVGGVPLQGIAGGGNPLLWQHLFWFLGHPEVYVLVLPAMGIVAEVITRNARRPLWGHGLMVSALLFMGGMSMVVWAHHMFLTGMAHDAHHVLPGDDVHHFDSVGDPDHVAGADAVGRIDHVHHADAVRAGVPADVRHRRLDRACRSASPPATSPFTTPITSSRTSTTWWRPERCSRCLPASTTGSRRSPARELDERLGKIHFWGSFVCMNLIFMPMFAIGLMGVNRRLWDAGASYAHAQPTLQWQTHMTYAAFALGVFQLPFIWNLFRTWSRRVDACPPAVTSHAPQPTGTSSARLGMWLFLASEAMLFASLFSAYVMLRMGAVEWPEPISGFPWLETLLLVGASATFSKERIRLIAAHTFALTFVVIKVFSDLALISKGITPDTNLMWACWFALTGVHALHVLGGAIFTGWLAGPAYRMSQAGSGSLGCAHRRDAALLVVRRFHLADAGRGLLCRQASRP